MCSILRIAPSTCFRVGVGVLEGVLGGILGQDPEAQAWRSNFLLKIAAGGGGCSSPMLHAPDFIDCGDFSNPSKRKLEQRKSRLTTMQTMLPLPVLDFALKPALRA